VMHLVLARGVWLTTAGLTAGLITALGLGRYMQHILFGVTPNDPLVLLAASALVLGAGALATIVPAMRAARSDPASLLRS
jgi:putative ABC transport system permease protein